MSFLRNEQKAAMGQDGRWKLFARKSPSAATAGSVLKVTYSTSRTEASKTTSFTGILIGVRRHLSDPTFMLRACIDGVDVEQLFHVCNPLISNIQVVQRAIKTKGFKAYWLRERLDKAPEFTVPKCRRK
jgi:ribosomal protein L19